MGVRAADRTRQWLTNVKAALTSANVTVDRKSWYRITNQAGPAAAAEVYIYDEIGFWGTTAGDFINELRQVDAQQIDLHLNSPGGEVFDGIAIYNALKTHPANVTVYVDSLAASIASVIAMAGDKVVMGRGSQMMIHEAAGLCLGNAADMRETADLLDRFSNNIAGFYADRAGGKVTDWRAAMTAESWYSADEAVKAGLADEVATFQPGDSQGPVTNSWDLSMFQYAGRDQSPAPTATGRGAVGPAFPRTAPPAAEPPSAPQPAATDTTLTADEVPEWGTDLTSVFLAAMAPPAIDPTAGLDEDLAAVVRKTFDIPAPPPETLDFVIDPSEFFNAVREATQ
jgi:ATP-dependent protease ClpP protease subunit